MDRRNVPAAIASIYHAREGETNMANEQPGHLNFGGIPVYINKYLPPGTIMMIGKDSPAPSILASDKAAIEWLMGQINDGDFLRRCGIVYNIGVEK